VIAVRAANDEAATGTGAMLIMLPVGDGLLVGRERYFLIAPPR
jgi:hypothetical protein